MKVTVDNNIKEAIRLASRFCGKGRHFPILQAVCLQAEGAGLGVQATDMNCYLYVGLGLEALPEEEGAVAIRGKVLADIVERLAGAGRLAEAITIEAGGERVILSAGGRQIAVLPEDGFDPQDFPPPPGGCLDLLAEAEAETFLSALHRLGPLASTDDDRPQLAGIAVAPREGGLTLAASDGWRLGMVDIPGRWYGGPPVLLRRDVLKLKVKPQGNICLRGREEDILELRFWAQLGQRKAVVSLHLQALPAKAPDYKAVLAKYSPATRVVLGPDAAEDLQMAVDDLAWTFAEGRNFRIDRVDLEIGEAGITVHGRVLDHPIPAQVDGPPTRVAVNARYLLGVLKAARTGEIRLSFGGRLDPVGVEVPDGRFLVMPLDV